jgi:deoxyribonuclease V
MQAFQGSGAGSLTATARAVQLRMRDRCGCGQGGQTAGIRIIGGADAAYAGENGIGVVTLFSYPELEPVDHAVAVRRVLFPYVPGLFAYRELPLCLAAFEKLTTRPDLLMFNGHGYAHPHRFGMACHAGALLGIPTIGVASRPLSGQSADPDRSRGSCAPLLDGEEVVGMAVRTREGSRPVYVSAGYRTGLSFAVEVTLTATRDRRMPIPLHAADFLARDYRRMM